VINNSHLRSYFTALHVIKPVRNFEYTKQNKKTQLSLTNQRDASARVERFM